MTLLCTAEDVLSSEVIAGSININPVLARKELSELIKNGLVRSREGKNGGYMLGRPAEKILVSEIYAIVKPEAILGKAKNKPNPSCRIGKQIGLHLDHLHKEIEETVISKLGKTTLQDFCNKFK